MRDYFRKTKRFFITGLVFIFSLSLLAPARADVGISIRTPLSATNQNIVYGNISNTGPVGNSLILMQNNGVNKFKVDLVGNVTANSYCDINSANCFTPSSGGFDTTNDSWAENSGKVWTNENVGIGTNNPAKKLNVDITAADDGYLLTMSGGTVNSKWTIVNPGVSNDMKFGTVANNGIQVITNDTERMRILPGGNVGIGTTAPGRLLDVNGISRFRDTMYFGSADDRGKIDWGGSPARMVVTAASGYGISLGSNNVNDRLFVDTSGNVGIGTNAPSGKLDIESSSGFALYINNNGSSVGDYGVISRINGPGFGVYGVTQNGIGLYGGADGEGIGVAGINNSGPTVNSFGYPNAAIFGFNGGGGYALYGWAQSDGYAVYGYAQSGGYSAYFRGAGYLSTSAWIYGSDRRLKDNIKYFDDSRINAIDYIDKLRPASFNYLNGEKNEAGFIAQDVQTVLPDLVTADSQGMLGLKTDDLIPYLVKGMQEQQAQIETLRQDNQALQAQIDLLNSRVGK